VAIAIAILLRILYIGSRELWYDEVLSLLLSTSRKIAYHSPAATPVLLQKYTSLLSLPTESSLHDFFLTIKNLLRSLVGGEPHPPLFFLAQHFWLRLWGNSEVAVRSLNAIISIVAIGSAYGLGKEILGHRGGLILAALLGISPFYLFHSLNMRMYAPLVLWTILSAWSLLHLINWTNDQKSQKSQKSQKYHIFWNGLLILSVACGLLTFYLYAYWIISLAVLAIYLDRKNWLKHGLRLGLGVILTIPWMLWGTRQQLRNADIDRFGKAPTIDSAWLHHLQDFCQTIGTDLLIGDWTTSISNASSAIAGCLVIALFIYFSISIWRRGERTNLIIALILGILPLLLSLSIDIITNKFTLGFGWGRTMIIILPGCLLLITLWLEKVVTKRWLIPGVTGLLLVYLTISMGDFSWRHRQVFHTVNQLISSGGNQPTLIAMNSKAWGNVLRLAYYIPPISPVMLLAEHPADLATSLAKVLQKDADKYSQIIWLDSQDPVWSKLPTQLEVEQEKAKVEKILLSHFHLKKSQRLIGTMSLDQFTANLYIKSPEK